MKRTIEVKRGGAIYWREKLIAKAMYSHTRQHFLRRLGKYQIIIKKGKTYQITPSEVTFDSSYTIRNIKTYREHPVCKSAFRKLFFMPDRRKRYDITVKEAK